MLVLAGAGSGKTRVLTTRIAYLIKEKNVSPWSILAITFTNKAAAEMKDRVEQLLARDTKGMWIGTFHSIAVRILRMGAEKIGYNSNFTIYDRDDQLTLLKEVYKELEVSDKTFRPAAALSVISNAKNQGISPEDFVSFKGNDFRNLIYADIYQSYEDKKKAYNSFDFDDLIVRSIELLEKDQDILSYYQEKFRYIFVDEYQDTNSAQYKMIYLLSRKYENVCVVGDGDQSIYGWRGADISNILDFEEDFPGASTVLLEENYRSTQSILNAANVVIKQNQERKDKNLWTGRGEGERPVYQEFDGEEAEARDVVDKIVGLQEEGSSLSDMAILYRTNAQSRAFEEALVHKQLPYVVVGGLKFYDRKEIKDILAYLKILVNPSDEIALARIINEPKRGIGQVGFNNLLEAAAGESLSTVDYILRGGNPLTGRGQTGLEEFYQLLVDSKRALKEKSLSKAVKEIVELTGMVDLLRDENSIEANSRLENIDSFISSVVSYEEENPEDDLEAYLAGVSLMSDVDRTDDYRGAVNLMTIHSAKGLEYDTVFLTGAEEGLFPSKFSIDEDNIEEERRLFYVAVTRACDNLFISSSSYRRIYGNLVPASPSRFVEELGDTVDRVSSGWKTSMGVAPGLSKREKRELTSLAQRSYLKKGLEARRQSLESAEDQDYKLGDKVRHKTFGEGTIVNIEEGEDLTLLISFEGKGLKKLRASMAPLEKI